MKAYNIVNSYLNEQEARNTIEQNNNQKNKLNAPTQEEINNHHPSLLSKISDKFNSPWVKCPLLIIGGGVLLSQVSCAGIVTPEPIQVEEDYVYLDVPYEKYGGVNWCLPASGTMVFNYYDVDISQQELANIVINEYGESSIFKLVKYAKDIGFEAKYNSVSIEEIKNLLKENIPPIAIQYYSLNISESHARVVIGYDDEKQEMITNDPVLGKDYKISYSDFLALNLNSQANSGLCKSIIIYPEDIVLDLP